MTPSNPQKTVVAAGRGTTVVQNNGGNDAGIVNTIYTENRHHRVPGPITLTLDNSGGGSTTTYAIGDPLDSVAANNGITAVAPTSGTVAPATFKEMLKNRSLVISRAHYKVESSSSQFAQRIIEAYADVDGSTAKTPLNLAAYASNKQEDDKLMILDVNWLLDPQNAIFIDVEAGEKVTITFTFAVSSM